MCVRVCVSVCVRVCVCVCVCIPVQQPVASSEALRVMNISVLEDLVVFGGKGNRHRQALSSCLAPDCDHWS